MFALKKRNQPKIQRELWVGGVVDLYTEAIAHVLANRQAFAIVGCSLPWTSHQREMGCTFPGDSDTR